MHGRNPKRKSYLAIEVNLIIIRIFMYTPRVYWFPDLYWFRKIVYYLHVYWKTLKKLSCTQVKRFFLYRKFKKLYILALCFATILCYELKVVPSKQKLLKKEFMAPELIVRKALMKRAYIFLFIFEITSWASCFYTIKNCRYP